MSAIVWRIMLRAKSIADEKRAKTRHSTISVIFFLFYFSTSDGVMEGLPYSSLNLLVKSAKEGTLMTV